MALGVAIAGVVVGAVGSYVSHDATKDAAADAEKAAKTAAAQAEEREARELRIQQEQNEYYANLAQERAEWEVGASAERTEFTAKRVQEEFDKVRAAQIAGYAASGVDISIGSPLAVMESTSAMADSELQQVSRSHDVFAATRTKEAEEVRKSGEAAYAWFSERLTQETGYEVESRLAEAASYRSKATYAQYGQYTSLGSSLLQGASMYIKQTELT